MEPKTFLEKINLSFSCLNETLNSINVLQYFIHYQKLFFLVLYKKFFTENFLFSFSILSSISLFDFLFNISHRFILYHKINIYINYVGF